MDGHGWDTSRPLFCWPHRSKWCIWTLDNHQILDMNVLGSTFLHLSVQQAQHTSPAKIGCYRVCTRRCLPEKILRYSSLDAVPRINQARRPPNGVEWVTFHGRFRLHRGISRGESFLKVTVTCILVWAIPTEYKDTRSLGALAMMSFETTAGCD